jgi:L-ribulose-5-phosphate 3-epimerase
MNREFSRRQFLQSTSAVLPLVAFQGAFSSWKRGADPLFRISLAEWSFNRELFAGEMTNLDFPKRAKREFGFEAVEYVNQFFREFASNRAYLRELHNVCDGEGVQSLLIMCDEVGRLGAPDAAERTRAVEGHYEWVEAAKFLGCHSIRVNAASEGTWDEQRDRAADGLRRLTEYAAQRDINVIVENHGGLSSNGEWLSSVMRQVDHPRCGTLPDFGNFQIAPGETYDRYKGVAELMPFAKGVSGKAHEFDERGEETQIDYHRMLRIVLESGYRGWIDVEYEGDQLSEPDGIRATKALLERVRTELEPEFS